MPRRNIIATFRKHFRFGVRQRVVLILLVGLLISLPLSGWLALREQTAYTDQEINRHGSQLAQILSHALASAVVSYDYQTIQNFLDDTLLNSEFASLVVYSSKGNVMAQAMRDNTDNSLLRIFKQEIQINSKKVGEIHVAINTTPIIASIKQQESRLITRELLTIIFLLFLEFIALSYLIIRPLHKISEALETRDTHAFLPNAVNLDSHDEFGDIARKFNQLRDQLQDAYRALQGKVDLADEQLRETNQHLLEKSSDLQRLNEELQRQAITDPLTGLPNRRKFQLLMNTQLRGAIASLKQFAMLIVDVDYFKKINDGYGHDIGDLVLIELAARLTQHIRKSDTVCRIGGEEFFILCCQTDDSQARHISEKIRLVVAESPFVVGNQRLSVTVSIGFASSEHHDAATQQQNDYASLIYRQADLALYNSKMQGRNRVSGYTDLPLVQEPNPTEKTS